MMGKWRPTKLREISHAPTTEKPTKTWILDALALKAQKKLKSTEELKANISVVVAFG